MPAGGLPERAAIPREVVILPSLPITAVGKVHKQALKLNITRRAVEEIVRGIVGAGDGFEVDVHPHALHGLDAVRQSLSAFAFRSTIVALDENRSA